MKKAQISAPLYTSDCVTALYAEVAVQSPTEKEQKFLPFSFIYNPPCLYLIDSANCPPSYSVYWTLIRGFSVHLQRLMWSLYLFYS